MKKIFGMLKFSGSIFRHYTMEYFKKHKLSLEFNWEDNNMTYLFFFFFFQNIKGEIAWF